MSPPTQQDYITVVTTLVEQFEKESAPTVKRRRGRFFTYAQRLLLVFFLLMHLRRIHCFKAQRRWLENHPEEARRLGFFTLPHRTTLSRRYKKLSTYLEELIAFSGRFSQDLGETFAAKVCGEDKSLFKAQGPVWHQSDREQGRIPDGLRNLDTDATFDKSGYHGWVYGYGLHTTVNAFGFPLAGHVETACVHEGGILDTKADIFSALPTHTMVADNKYTNLERVERFARKGIVLLTPAYGCGGSQKGRAYLEFVRQQSEQALLKARKTMLEPCFDLISHVAGTTNNHKQLPRWVKGLARVSTFLLLSTFIVQVAMIANDMWGLPLHNISHLMSVFS